MSIISEDSFRDLNSIEKKRNVYLIKVNINSSLDIIVKENDFYYESIFTEDDIQQVFDDPNKNINKVYELIKQGDFKIKKNNNNLKLIFPQERELNIKISSSSLRFQKIIIIALILVFILNIIFII